MASPQPAHLICEFIGTFLLVFTVGCNVLSGNALWGGVSIGCVLMVSIYTMGKISGGHFNPAVTFSLALSQTMGGHGVDWVKACCYIVVQLIAGLVAAACYIVLFWDTFNLAPAKGFNWFDAGVCELFYTFMLCFVVLNVTAKNRDNEFYGLAIGFVIVAGAYGAGAVSGGCFNPAVAIGIDTSSAGLGFGWCFVYILFELAGAALATGLFKLVRPADFSSDDADAGRASLVSRLLSEFLGTFMLMLTVGLNVLGNSLGGAFSIGASLMCMIYALGDISGAHFNPAVTLAILVSGRDKDLEGKTAVFYMVTQIVGALVAAFTYAGIYHGESFELGPKVGFGWSDVVVAEVICTFVLCFVVLGTAVAGTKSKEMFGLAIGACITAGGTAIGGVSGGSLNPAVSWGIAASHILGGGMFYKALIYTFLELIGGALAGVILKVTHAHEYKDKEEDLARAKSES